MMSHLVLKLCNINTKQIIITYKYNWSKQVKKSYQVLKNATENIVLEIRKILVHCLTGIDVHVGIPKFQQLYEYYVGDGQSVIDTLDLAVDHS